MDGGHISHGRCRSGIRTSHPVGLHRGARVRSGNLPDAKWVAYLSNARGPTDVWVKFIAGGDAINLTASAKVGVQSQAGISGLEISPDRSQIAFAASTSQTTWVIPAPTGGVPRPILARGDRIPVVARRQADGLHLRRRTARRQHHPGRWGRAEPTEIVKRAGARHIHWLRWAPDGQFVYFNYGAMSGNTEGTEIFRASIPDGRLEPVVRTARRAAFPVPSPDGRGLFYAANPDSLDLGLWWRDLDSGRDVRVTTGVGEYAEATIWPIAGSSWVPCSTSGSRSNKSRTVRSRGHARTGHRRLYG